MEMTDAARIIKQLFPNAEITSTHRASDHPLSIKNPTSYHTKTKFAVDVKPIAGVTYEQFIGALKENGFKILEAINETGSGKTSHATGDHWHVVFDPTSSTIGNSSGWDWMDPLGKWGYGAKDFYDDTLGGGSGENYFSPFSGGIFSSELVTRIVAVIIGVVLVGLAIAAVTLTSDAAKAVIKTVK